MAAIPFDELKVGWDCGSYEYRLTRGRILKYSEAVEDLNPWYEKDSPFGGPIASPTVCDNDITRLPGWKVIRGGDLEDPSNYRPGFLHAKQEYDFLNPARPGKKVKVSGRIVDKYVKRGREYVTVEALSVDEDGVPLLRTRGTLCWLAQKKEG